MPARGGGRIRGKASRRAGPRGSALAYIVAALIIVAVAALWLSLGRGGGVQAPKTTTTIVSSSPTGAYQMSVQGFSARLASYGQKSQFTALYRGSIRTTISTSPIALNAQMVSEFQRYNGFARAATSVTSDLYGTLNSSVYYMGNGTSYVCTSNGTSPYSCQTTASIFNSSNFGLSTFLGLVSNSTNPLTLFNSSYNGVPCIGVSTQTIGSHNSTGATITMREEVSGCIQPVYRIPLILNISMLNTVSGRYPNGTAIVPTSESIALELHLVNLTNSSNQSALESLPANAIVLG